jgi:lycopene cyclase domain-containing protein
MLWHVGGACKILSRSFFFQKAKNPKGMMETKWLYLLLNAMTISVPLIRSFEPRINFYSKWKALFAAIFLVGAFFIVWDVLFTMHGVWGFNPKYLSGIYIFHLPLGEWLFFVTVPYACVFIYEVLNYFWPNSPTADKISKYITLFLIGLSAAIVIAFISRAYPFWNFLFLGLFLLFLHFYLRPIWMGKLYRAYAVGLIGFFLVNGILTGTGIEEQVVWYNSFEIIGIRFGTIPFEDGFYGFLLIAMVVTLYEYFKKKL